MQTAGLDLNLLLALDALLEEASVTRAAHRLHLSQPALSSSLAKLRRHFDDELLHRVGNHNVLTPLALQLRERTGVAMESVERVFAGRPVFDPETADHEFALLGPDDALAVVGGALGRRLHRTAPGIRLRLGVLGPTHAEPALELLRRVDGIVLPHGSVGDLPHTDLYEDGWVCLVSADNDHVGEDLTPDRLAGLPWVTSAHQVGPAGSAGRVLDALGISPRVQVVIDSVLALPYVLAGTERVALAQEQVAARLAAAGTVRSLPCPVDLPRVRQALWWHPMNERDAAHAWLRQALAEACTTLS
jgi:DNA-binding transcriptional LysR family regulator